MTEDIKLQPELPKGLRDAAQRGTLVPFIGAGASRMTGLPGWAEFADKALGQCLKHGKISHAQQSQINPLSPKIRLFLADDLLATGVDYKEILDLKKLNPELAAKGKRLYGSLAKLSKTFITTNYDEWLHEYSVDMGVKVHEGENHSQPSTRRTPYYNPEDFTPANLDRPDTVIHLHGCVLDRESMVLTVKDYIKQYANDRKGAENNVLTLLEYLFKNKTVLFVGYGLEELEILEYVITKSRLSTADDNKEANHYILQGFFSYEVALAKSLSSYFLKECGVELIPFLKDDKGHEQLLEVLDTFAKTAPASDPLYIQDFVNMENMLNG